MAVTSTHLKEGFAFEIKVDQFVIDADVAQKLGGQDSAPNPHHLLEASLAGCTAMTVQMYAKRKNMPLDYADVRIKIVAEGARNEILREIRFIGEGLSNEDKAMLMNIADKCPIHKILSNGVQINSQQID